MGYSTWVEGSLRLNKPLEPQHREALDSLLWDGGEISVTLEGVPAPEGGYGFLSADDESGHYLGAPDQDVSGHYVVEWLQFTVRLLWSWGYMVEGELYFQGSENEDFYKYVATGNRLDYYQGVRQFHHIPKQAIFWDDNEVEG